MTQEQQDRASKTDNFTVVGLGASAGGLEAYEEFFSHLPAKPGCAFVLVMHLDPHHKSMLPDLLSKVTGMQVSQAEDGMRIEPDRIHVIPPDTSMFVDGKTLKLEKAKATRGARKPIDEFFRSLAEQRGDKAVGIIFSGTGSDGTQGLREIKFAGGMSMVQDPSTAKFDAMPANAIQAGVVDVVKPSAELAVKLTEYLEKRGEVLRDKSPDKTGGKDELEELLEEIHAQTGRDVSVYKRSTLMRRIEKRMLLRERLTLGEYKKLLNEDGEEIEQLQKELLIGVTSFFRDAEAFNILREQVLPEVFTAKDKEDAVRIWVPGCASGEEAYSIAMTVSMYMEENKTRKKVQIFATDVDEDAIAGARTGVYPASSATDVPEEYRERYFSEKNGHHVISSKIREMVVFAPHDVIENPPFFKLDVISCRNLLIYLNPEVQKRIIPLFFYSLLPNGYLMLGPAETLGKHSELFEPVSSKWKIFRRKDIPAKRVDIPMSSKGGWTGIGAKGQTAYPWDTAGSNRGHVTDYRALLHGALVRLFSIPAVLIDDRDVIVQVHGDVHEYFGLTEGDPSNDVYRMAREPLRPHLRSAVHKARKNNEIVTYKGLRFDQQEQSAFNLTVSPALGAGKDGKMLILAFESMDEPREGGSELTAEVARDELVKQLEEELRISNEQLQATIENLDSANEELKSSNEELMSMNEELQSSNEELETSQEELQALNEELTTVNSELQAKITELDDAKSDLENLLRSTDIATLFIDRDLVIRQFTPAATNIFNIEDDDVGRPLEHFAHKAPGEDIIGEARAVLKTLKIQEKEIRTEDGSWYLSRMLPYKSLDDSVDGVVLTYVDITERTAMEEELKEHKQKLEDKVDERSREIKRQRDLLSHIMDILPVGVFIADQHGGIDVVNSAAETIWGGLKRLPLDRLQEYKGRWADSGEPVQRWAFARAFEDGESADDELIDIECFDGSRKTIRNWARPVKDEEGGVISAVAVILDVTSELEALRSAEEGKQLLDAMMEHIPEGITIADAPDATIRMVSRHGLEMINKPKDAITGIPYKKHPDIWQVYYDNGETLVPPEELPLTRATLNGEVIENQRLRIVDSAGGMIPLLCNAAPLKSREGKITGGLIAWRDVSELEKTRQELIKAKDMAQAANEAKSAFLANISHEIRTPLSGIMGMAELLSQKPGSDEAGKRADFILRAGEQLLAIIDDVLDLSRIEVNRVTISEEPASISQLLDRVKLTHIESAMEKGLGLEVHKDEEVPEIAVLDSKRTGQILNNLVSNAVKFTHEGAVDLKAGVDKDGGQSRLVFEVADTGIGIPDEKLSRIFEDFYQVENYLSKEHEGTGLGLAISNRLADLMGGSLSVISEEGKGSRFFLSISLKTGETSSPDNDKATPEPDDPGRLKILVAEDNQINRYYMVELLKSMDMEIKEAVDGREAVDMALSEDFDIVLMDVQMPNMDGVQATKRIREKKGGDELKIVALTAYAMQGDRERFLNAGMDGYLAKPVERRQVNDVIRNVMAGGSG